MHRLQKELCKIMAKENLDQSDVDRFRAILTDPDKGCNFISEEESRKLPPNVLRVFPKRASARKAQDDLVSNLKRGTIVLERSSIDEETMQASSSGGNNVASPSTVAKLDKLSKMTQRLQLFQGAMVQMTYNSKKFTQGQLAMLLELPTKEALNNFEPIKIFLAPVGTKIGSFQGYSREELETLGWQEISVGKHTDQSWKRVGNGLLGRRSQYPFILKMSMTIHASMGATLPKLVTSVIKENTLWMSELVVVLLSRSEMLRGMYFIGSADDTVNALILALLKKNRFHKYMHRLLRNMGVRASESPSEYIDRSLLPWIPHNTDLPGNGFSVVYLLRSLKDGKSTYIGSTKNLVKRQRSHNRGEGSMESCDPGLRPWHVIGYICGFQDQTKASRIHVEQRWKHLRDRRGGNALLPVDVMNIGISLANEPDLYEPHLRFVSTGRFQIANEGVVA